MTEADQLHRPQWGYIMMRKAMQRVYFVCFVLKNVCYCAENVGGLLCSTLVSNLMIPQ